jgi:alpha-amylase/alpha-mannosidase (GH57 family)
MAELRKANSEVCLALVWHMHQPHYENALTGHFELPWVRLHGAKDYYDMAAVAESYPNVRFTINVVPSLLEQIDDYLTGKRSDRFLDLSRRGPSDLDATERRFIEQNFFSANETTMIARYPRYAELHLRYKNRVRGRPDGFFSDSELRDLIVLFNLTWIDPSFFADSELKRLADKGRYFSEDDKHLVLDRHLEILGRIVPLYRRLREEGRIELSVSPYYHPILPLLLDSDCARESVPHVRLPRTRIQYPDDFDEQVRTALDRFTEAFGVRPAGMWPSEGSVSDAAVRRLATHGLTWAASDEEILRRSRLAGTSPDPRYAYLVGDGGDEEIALVFRNKRLSDLIGFSYMNWDPKEAARDFTEQVLEAAGGSDSGAPPLVPVILDGENCWEYYPEDGLFFLRELYGLLDSHPSIEMVTVSEYLERYPPTRRIDRLFAGSWINHNFDIWIGHSEDNAAWDLLSRTRSAVMTAAQSRPAEDGGVKAARRHLAIAEGSDWFWWYGDEHWCAHIEVFDQLFRAHLTAAYEAVGLVAPAELRGAIKGRFGRPRSDEQVPVRFIAPQIDGRVTHFYEWKLAGKVEVAEGGGTMHQVDSQLRAIHYGFDLSHLFVRVDGADRSRGVGSAAAGDLLVIEITRPRRMRVEVEIAPQDGQVLPARLTRFADGGFSASPSGSLCAVDQVVEVQMPFADLGITAGDTVELAVLRMQDGRTLESLPARSPVVFRAPDHDFEAMMWSAS